MFTKLTLAKRNNLNHGKIAQDIYILSPEQLNSLNLCKLAQVIK